MAYKLLRAVLVVVAIVLAANVSPASAADRQDDNRILVIAVDGLRPDYVTDELTPNLYRMKQEGAFGARSSAVFPSFTRPNRTSIPTGVYPGTHGILHNNLPHPSDDSAVHTGNRSQMLDYEQAAGEPMITTISLGEILDWEGDRLLTLGTGAWLQNHRDKGKGSWTGGGSFYPGSAIDDPQAYEQQVLDAVGQAPDGGRSPERTAWTVDLYLHDALSDDPAEVVLMWLGYTDAAGHAHGVGAPQTLEALSDTDEQIGRILEQHQAHDIDEQVNIFITSDHGFTTSIGGFNRSDFPEEAGLEEHVTNIRNMFFVRSGEQEHLEQMVEFLHRHEAVGSIYTQPAEPGQAEGRVPGTLSMELIQWHHDRSPDIIAAPAWNDQENEYGWPGATTRSGTATHGSDSPWDLHIPLIAYGPDIKLQLHSDVPTGNIDLTPTILHLRGIKPLKSMDGRVLHELLIEGPNPERVEYHRDLHRVWRFYDDGLRYETMLETMQVGDTVYLRGAHTDRQN